MKKIVVVVFAVAIIALFASGCATVAENKAHARVVKSQADVIVSDNELYLERSQLWQNAIKKGAKTAKPEESASEESVFEDEITIRNGYKNGKPVIIINDSHYDLDIEIADSHGRVFKFQLARGESKGGEEEFKLEIGNHRVRSFRARELNQRPFTETIMGVKSIPYFYYGTYKNNQDKRYCGYTIIRGGSGW